MSSTQNSGLGHGTVGAPQGHVEEQIYPAKAAENEASNSQNHFPGGRTREEYSALARDPARGAKVDYKGQKERSIVLDLESQGRIGKVIRDPQANKGADFIDTTSHKKWDVKSPVSHPKGHRSPRKGAFEISRMMANVRKEIARGHSVILDTRRLTKEDRHSLKSAIETEDLKEHVIWYDKRGE